MGRWTECAGSGRGGGRRTGRRAGPVGSPPGYTLIELIMVLLVLGILLGLGVPPAARWRDGAAVVAARDQLAGGLAMTRLVAVSASGATLVLDPARGRFRVHTAAGDALAPVDLRHRYRVRVDVGSDEPVLFHYDALGIGRITSRTVRVRRRAAEAGLTVSAYGRFRRW